MPTLTISEKTFNDFKQEQTDMRYQTGERWNADKLVSYLLELKRKVKK